MRKVNPQKILILGGGNSGVAAAELAQKQGAETVLLDTSSSPKCAEQLRLNGITCVTGPKALEYNVAADLSVISPGVPADSPLAELAKKLSPATVSELTFGASFLDTTMLAVTGTNGKTTTVEMLTHILNECGIKTLAAGNIGLPLCRVALQNKKLDALVVEISSFQLEHANGFHPDAAAILNITPDHLERHHSIEKYAELKISLCDSVKKNGITVVNEITEKKYALKKTFKERNLVTFGENGDARIRDYSLILNGIAVADFKKMRFSGKHNMENAAAAIMLAGQMGIQAKLAAEKLRTFEVGEHRMQTVLVKNGIRFIDDSKATNADAMLAALRTLDNSNGPTALIAGGLDKNCDLDEPMEMLSTHISEVFLIGNCAERLKKLWGKVVPCKICSGMEDAVFKAAASLKNTGGTVLLSPACASMDMFPDYAIRGNCFKEAALKYSAAK